MARGHILSDSESHFCVHTKVGRYLNLRDEKNVRSFAVFVETTTSVAGIHCLRNFVKVLIRGS